MFERINMWRTKIQVSDHKSMQYVLILNAYCVCSEFDNKPSAPANDKRLLSIENFKANG